MIRRAGSCIFVMMKTFVIGDIHGGLKALQQVLKKATVSPDDQLIFLGDYVDGWSDSAHVISFLIDLAKKQSCIFIRGNHDDLVHHWLKTGEMNEKWLMHGGQSTLDAYRQLSSEEIRAHLHFFNQLINFYKDAKNRLFLHAGFASMHGPEYEYEPYVLYWDRTLWEMVLALDQNLKPDDLFYPKRLKLFDEIFIGHTPTLRINATKPVQAANVWNVDTGAAFTGPLTIMEVNSKEIFQSKPVHQLYPGENGRN